MKPEDRIEYIINGGSIIKDGNINSTEVNRIINNNIYDFTEVNRIARKLLDHLNSY